MKKIIGFFEESAGQKSFTRLASGIIIAFALLWGTVEVATHCFKSDFIIHTELILGTLAIGITGKVAQKRYESDQPNEESTTT